MASKSVLLSRQVVVTLNATVALVCVLFALGILLPSSQLHIVAKLISAAAPVLTILFFLPRVPNRVLGVVAVAANLIVIASSLVFFYRIATISLTQPLLVLAAVLFVLLFLVPAISLASVASHWPSHR